MTRISSPILVTGAERSGSSIIAKIISLCGAFTGDSNNMYENLRIKKCLVNYYQYIGIDYQTQYPLPDRANLPNNMNVRELVLRILYEEGLNGENPWMYKSPKICQVWPMWHKAFPEAQWIVVRRRTGDIVNSCLHTAYMYSYSNKVIQNMIEVSSEREGWIWWVREHEKMFQEMEISNLKMKVVWPERMVTGDFTQVKQMIEWLGLAWNEDIPKLIKPMLVNSKINIEKI